MVKSCDLLYADGEKYVWSVVSENEESFPINPELCADGCVWVNNGVKKVLNGESWDAVDPLPITENGTFDVDGAKKVNVNVSGGGGLTFPTFTADGTVWSCDMTYAEAKAVWTENEDVRHSVPCFAVNEWVPYSLFAGEDFQQAKSDFNNVPDDMTEGCIIMGSIPLLFGSDGNFYL